MNEARNPDPTEPGPLELATEEELINQLAKRNVSIVVIMLAKDKASREESFKSFFRGGYNAAVGLTSRLHAKLLRGDAIEDEEDDDPI